MLSGLRRYVVENPTNWKLFTDALMCAYKNQVHYSTALDQFYIVLSSSTLKLTLQSMMDID